LVDHLNRAGIARNARDRRKREEAMAKFREDWEAKADN
jgi:hypothetical protein